MKHPSPKNRMQGTLILGLLFVLGFVPRVFAFEGSTSDPPPNVIVFLSDDQGWGDFGFQGNSNFETPNIDRLAKEGTYCSRFYVCPVCAPTRAEFLTGRYHPRGGAVGVTQGDERLDLDEVTLADRLQKRGYATGAFGKWHNGSQYPYHPNGRGFQEFYGFCSGHWGDYFSPPLERNGEPCRGNGFVADDFTDHAMAFIQQHRDRPFFCYVAFNTPHTPMQVPGIFFDRVRDQELRMRHAGRKEEIEEVGMTRAAIAMVENLDANVGRVLNQLDQLGLSKKTIVLYFNDNGPNSYRWNGGMRGRKGTTHEGGVRSPLLVRWPGKIPTSRTIDQLAGAIDLVPTLCELTGTPIAQETSEDQPLDGISLASQLLDTAQPVVSRTLFTQWGGKVAMRQDQYLSDPDDALFDVVADPGQTMNLAKLQPDRAASMTKAKATWKTEVLDKSGPKRPFLVGHPVRPKTELPAQDGKCSGPSVRRSTNAPNCSYFTRMMGPEDVITWDVQFLQSGDYEVVVEYTASQSAVGIPLQCQASGMQTERTIEKVFDSDSIGKEHDLVPRQSESLMKEFAEMSLGQITVQAETTQVRIHLREELPPSGDEDSVGVEIRAVHWIKR